MTGEDKDWSYRLSLYYVTKKDTNIFECKTPRGLVNRITVVVTGTITFASSSRNFRVDLWYFTLADVECRDFNISDNELESRLEGRKVGAEARFSCPRGFELAEGPSVVTCQRNGEDGIFVGTCI